WGLAIIVAPAIGPTLGGYLVDYVNWRLIFYINVPVGVIGVLLAMAYLPAFPKNLHAKFDALGFGFIALSLFSLLLAFSEGSTWGWTSEPIILLVIGAVFALILFVLWELKCEHPLLNLRIYRYGSFALSNVISFVLMVAMYSGVFYVPLFLQTVVGYSAFHTGIIMMPAALASAIMMPIAGRLFDKIGGRPLVATGLAILTATTYLLHNLSPNTSATTVAGWLALRGIGMGLAMMPTINAGMSALPTKDTGSGSVLNNVMQRVAGSFGLALLTSVLTTNSGNESSMLSATFHPANPTAMQTWHMLINSGVAQGLTVQQATQLTTTEVYGLVQQMAFTLGVDDIFVVGTAIAAVAFILSLFLKTYRQGSAGQFEQTMAD
ncbi:MAG: DHA2 family efflux MFS transporter permease subunit, partial [Firmicutes bacterium]|nr:DHA2 family efflux MFS transporter permease subunit [Bacillota bacterium]